jgi:hypothetical protein
MNRHTLQSGNFRYRFNVFGDGTVGIVNHIEVEVGDWQHNNYGTIPNDIYKITEARLLYRELLDRGYKKV